MTMTPENSANGRDHPVETDGFDVAAAERNQRMVIGSKTKFSNGAFMSVSGKEKTLILPEMWFVVAMFLTLWGWEYWRENDEGKWELIDARMGRVSDKSFKRLKKSPGTVPESQWPINPNSGKPEDPWKPTRRMVLMETGGATLHTFVTSTWSGCAGVDDLIADFTKARKDHSNKYPVVQLSAANKQSITTGDSFKAPCFKIVSWEDKKDLDAALGGQELVVEGKEPVPQQQVAVAQEQSSPKPLSAEDYSKASGGGLHPKKRGPDGDMDDDLPFASEFR